MARLRETARRTGRPLKAVVNDAIRAGLDPTRPQRNPMTPPPELVESAPVAEPRECLDQRGDVVAVVVAV